MKKMVKDILRDINEYGLSHVLIILLMLSCIYYTLWLALFLTAIQGWFDKSEVTEIQEKPYQESPAQDSKWDLYSPISTRNQC